MYNVQESVLIGGIILIDPYCTCTHTVHFYTSFYQTPVVEISYEYTQKA